jgi:hypothetical protein
MALNKVAPRFKDPSTNVWQVVSITGLPPCPQKAMNSIQSHSATIYQGCTTTRIELVQNLLPPFYHNRQG